MGLYVTDARDATLTRRRTSRHRPVGDNTPVRHRNVRGIPVRPRNPLRGPIRKAISGYRYYHPELGRWLNRDPLGDHASDGARELHGKIALDMAMAAVRSMSIAINEDVEPSLRLTAAIDAEYWLEGIRVLQSGDPSFSLYWYDPTTGQWLCNDPIGINGGLNLYVAFGNNPVMFVDPDGNIALNLASGGVGALIGGGVGAVIGGINDGWRGALRGGLAGAAGGFVSGATFGAATAAGLVTGWGTGVAIGAGTGALGGLASGVVGESFDAVDGDCETNFEGRRIFESVGWGMLGGGFTGGVGGFAGEAFGDITAGVVGGLSEIYTTHVFPGAAEIAAEIRR